MKELYHVIVQEDERKYRAGRVIDRRERSRV